MPLVGRIRAPQFTSTAFTSVLIATNIKSSLKGKESGGKVFVEFVRRSIKCDEVNLKACANEPEASASIGKLPDFYNGHRQHQHGLADAGSGLLQCAAAGPGCGRTKGRQHL